MSTFNERGWRSRQGQVGCVAPSGGYAASLLASRLRAVYSERLLLARRQGYVAIRPVGFGQRSLLFLSS